MIWFGQEFFFTKPLVIGFFPLHTKPSRQVLACENIRFSSLFAAGDVSRGGTSATQRQKFNTDDAIQFLRAKRPHRRRARRNGCFRRLGRVFPSRIFFPSKSVCKIFFSKITHTSKEPMGSYPYPPLPLLRIQMIGPLYKTLKIAPWRER